MHEVLILLVPVNLGFTNYIWRTVDFSDRPLRLALFDLAKVS
jgi:hypothetical protein